MAHRINAKRAAVRALIAASLALGVASAAYAGNGPQGGGNPGGPMNPGGPGFGAPQGGPQGGGDGSRGSTLPVPAALVFGVVAIGAAVGAGIKGTRRRPNDAKE